MNYKKPQNPNLNPKKRGISTCYDAEGTGQALALKSNCNVLDTTNKSRLAKNVSCNYNSTYREISSSNAVNSGGPGSINLIPAKIVSRGSSSQKQTNLSITNLALVSKQKAQVYNDEMLSSRKTDITSSKQLSQNTIVSGNSFNTLSNGVGSQYQQSTTGFSNQIRQFNPSKHTTQETDSNFKFNPNNHLKNTLGKGNQVYRSDTYVEKVPDYAVIDYYESSKETNFFKSERPTSNQSSVPLSISSIKCISETKRSDTFKKNMSLDKSHGVFTTLNSDVNDKQLITYNSVVHPKKHKANNSVFIGSKLTFEQKLDCPDLNETYYSRKLATHNQDQNERIQHNSSGKPLVQFKSIDKTSVPSHYQDTYKDLDFNLEDLLMHDEKIIDIHTNLASDPSDFCYELWKFYHDTSLYSKLDNMQNEDETKNIILEHTLLEFISVILCYDCQKQGSFALFRETFDFVFKRTHQSFLIISDYFINQHRKSCFINPWVSKLKQLMKKGLRHIPSNNSERFEAIKLNCDSVQLELKFILKDIKEKAHYHNTLMNFLYNLSSANLQVLDNIFKGEVLKLDNNNGSAPCSVLRMDAGISVESEEIMQNHRNLKFDNQNNEIGAIAQANSAIKKLNIKSIIPCKSDQFANNGFKLNKSTAVVNPIIKRGSIDNKIGREKEEPEFNPSMARALKVDTRKQNLNSLPTTDRSSNEQYAIINRSLGYTKHDEHQPYLRNSSMKCKYSLVLDLNETLIHYRVNSSNENEGEMLFRPYMLDFMSALEPHYELILFTTGTQEYGLALAKGIEEDHKYFAHKFFRQHATSDNIDFIKDLSLIGRPIDKTIIVDNTAVNFKRQKENAVLIKSYYGNYKTDLALFYLKDILLRIAVDSEITDVREGLKLYKDEILWKVSSSYGWE